MRFLWTWSGEDWRVLRVCRSRVRRMFACIGLTVLVVFALCFCSALYATIRITDSQVAGWIIGLFFAGMMSNLYLLILFTLSRNVMRHKKAFAGLRLSRLLRFGFVLLMAVLVAKPLEYWIYRESNERLVHAFRLERMAEHHAAIDEQYSKRIDQCQEILSSSLLGAAQRDRYRQKLADLKREQLRDTRKIDRLLAQSHFFIQGIKLHHGRHQETWFFTILVMLLFIAPALTKLFIPTWSVYTRERVKVERKMVEEEYRKMCETYTELFHRATGRRPVYPERYLDPPYRLKRKHQGANTVKKQSELIKVLYRS